MFINFIFLAVCLPFMAKSLLYPGDQSLLREENMLVRLNQPMQNPEVSLPDFRFLPIHQRRSKQLSVFEKSKRTIDATTRNEISIPRAQQFAWANPHHVSTRIVRQDEDYILYAEAIAPSGSDFIWYKNGQPIQGNISSSSSQRDDGSDIPSSSPRLHIVSYVYIDCAQAEDAGLYSLEVRNPYNRQVLSRSYRIVITDWYGVNGVTCAMQASIMSFFPRIYQNARYAIAQEGDSIILPCRYQGTSLSRVWYRRNERISDEDPNHQMLPDGDLQIKRLSGGPSLISYACRVVSTAFEVEPDIIFTTVAIEGATTNNSIS